MGYVLIVLGGFLFISRLLNQPEMIRRFLVNKLSKGSLFAIRKWIKVEILGIFPALGLIFLGWKLL
jgi:hypothetical protein